MTTQATVAATAVPVESTKKRREKKSWSTVMTSADGRAVKVTATKKSDGAKTYVLLSTPIAGSKKRKNERGATSPFPSIEAAKAHQEKLVAEMKKRGWTVKEPSPRGFVARPDAFSLDNLPVAATAAPAKPGKSSKKK